MPKEISGNVVNERRFTGRVAHVRPNGFANGDVRSRRKIPVLRGDRPPAPRARAGNFQGAFNPRDCSPKKSHNSPGTRSPARGNPRALSVATISMFFPLTPMRWGFVLPTLRAKD